MKIKSLISLAMVVCLLCSLTAAFSGVASAASYSATFEAEDASLWPNPNPAKPQVTKMNASTKIQLGSMEYQLTSGYSGTGAVAITNNPPESADLISFAIDVPSTGLYNVTFTSADVYKGETRKNALFVNGEYWNYFYSGQDTFKNDTISGVYLKSGYNILSIRRHSTCDGNIYFDKIKVELASDSVDFYNVQPVLSNPNSSATTKRLFSYLCDNYGKTTITGQFSNSATAVETKALQSATGKTPAILGFDLLNYTSCYAHYQPQNVQKLKVTQNIVDWVKNYNGIATVTWHWYAPYQYIKGSSWTSSFRNTSIYTKATSDHPMYLSTKRIMGGQDQEGYNLLLNDIDRIAAQIKILQQNDVPILFRPLHEAGGNETAASWFWWGQDKDSYIKLWKLIYDRFTDYYGLDNIIWVWNGQDPAWYPGDNYCDIIGWDVYPDSYDYTASSNRFWQSTNYVQNKSHLKMVTLSENGTMPSIDKMISNNTLWSYFCTWSGDYVCTSSGNYTEKYTAKTEANKLFNSTKTTTLDELPANLYSSYPIGATSYTLTKSASEKYQDPYNGGYIPSTDTDTHKDTNTDRPQPSGDRKYGDVNGDGYIDVTDIVLLRANIIGSRMIDADSLFYADVNADGTVDIIDVVMLRALIVG